LRTNDKIN